MPYEESATIRQLALAASPTWTDVTGAAIPIDCNQVVIFNNSGVDIYMRTDPGNPNSQVTINNGQQYEFTGPVPRGFRSHRFPKNSTVCSLQPSSGTPSVVIECTR